VRPTGGHSVSTYFIDRSRICICLKCTQN
jgi:hypothetical protein